MPELSKHTLAVAREIALERLLRTDRMMLAHADGPFAADEYDLDGNVVFALEQGIVDPRDVATHEFWIEKDSYGHVRLHSRLKG